MKIESQMCQKLIYKNSNFDDSPSILFGMVVMEDHDFLVFRTAKKEYKINKILIISIESTDKPFQNER